MSRIPAEKQEHGKHSLEGLPRPYVFGQLVWAKMKGYPPYPGIIVNEEDVSVLKSKRPKKSLAVQFFGSGEYSYIPFTDITPFFKDLVYKKAQNKTSAFKRAVEAAERYIAKNPDVANLEKSDGVKGGVDEKKADLKFPSTESAAESSNSKAGRKRKRHIHQTKLSTRVENGHNSETDIGDSAHEDAVAVDSTKKERKDNGSYDVITSDCGTWSVVNSDSQSSLAEESADESVEPPETEQTSNSDKSTVKVSSKRFGFIVGTTENIDTFLVSHLVDSGHKVTVYSEEDEKKRDYEQKGIPTVHSLKELVNICDILISCLGTEEDIIQAWLGSSGLICALQELEGDASMKGYVELTVVSRYFAKSCYEKISAVHTKYLEAPVVGSVDAARKGKLMFFCSGDRQLFRDCSSFFEKTSAVALHLTDRTGNGCIFKAAMDMIRGALYGSVSEACALLEAYSLNFQQFLACVQQSDVSCELMQLVSDKMKKADSVLPNTESLSSMAKSLKVAVGECNIQDVLCPISASVCESMKNATKHGYGGHDAIALLTANSGRNIFIQDPN